LTQKQVLVCPRLDPTIKLRRLKLLQTRIQAIVLYSLAHNAQHLQHRFIETHAELDTSQPSALWANESTSPSWFLDNGHFKVKVITNFDNKTPSCHPASQSDNSTIIRDYFIDETFRQKLEVSK
jgi:hypothetical protein